MALVRLAERISPDAAVRSAIVALPPCLAALIDRWFDQRPRLLAPLQPASGITVVGRGIGHSVALETALKLREVGGVMTEAYSPASLLHGPIAAIRPPQDLWLSASPDYDVGYWTEFLARIRPRVRNVIVVSHYDQLLEDSHIAIKLPPDKADWPYAILGA